MSRFSLRVEGKFLVECHNRQVFHGMLTQKKLRILLVNDHVEFTGGGAAVFRFEQQFLQRQGFEVFTFSHARTLPKCRSKNDFVHVEKRGHIIRKAGKFIGNPSVSRAFRDALECIKPHVVHLHLATRYPLNIYPELTDYPTIQTLHGPYLFCATGWGCVRKNSDYCSLGVDRKCLTMGCVPFWQYPVLRQFNQRLLRLAQTAVNRFLCPSKQLLDSARRMGLRESEYVPLGIDHCFSDSRLATHEGPPVILFVGVLGLQKGPHVLLDAFVRLKRCMPDVTLHFAGSGPLLPYLKEQAAMAGVLDSVKFLGFLGRSDLLRHYRDAHVLAVPSLWQEQFGLIGPEALACGVPCVGSDIGGIPEWLRDGEWGFLVPPRDSIALEKNLFKLLSDCRLRQTFGEKGRAFILQHFGPDQHEENLLRIVWEHVDQSSL